jgi:hypothetical protein
VNGTLFKMSNAFDKIAEGRAEVLAIARGKAGPARLKAPERAGARPPLGNRATSQGDIAAQPGPTFKQNKE